MTEELKFTRQKILGAEDKILLLETSLFNDLAAGSLICTADTIQCQPDRGMDCLLSFDENGCE